MTDPKRAEPNEHAANLERISAELWEEHGHSQDYQEVTAAAAEIERLAARVRQLEGKICLGCLYGASEPQS